MNASYVTFQIIIMLYCLTTAGSVHELRDIQHIFSKCKKQSPQFDACMKRALNDIRPYFKRGIPEIGVAPFDPHFAKEIKQKRSIFGIGYTLILRNVYESGWSKSTVTEFKTDWTNASIIYSQYFPKKYLEGQYEFQVEGIEQSSAGGAGAAPRVGRWNLTLRDYAQSTWIARSPRASGVSVRVEVDRIGDMDLHITHLLMGRTTLERLLDGVINTFWKPGLIFVRPLVNDLVSTAFTHIWSESFKFVQIQNFIKD